MTTKLFAGQSSATGAPPRPSWFIERHSIDPIPVDQRHGKLWTSVTVWAALNATPQTIAAGAFGIALGLPIWACCLGIVIGSLFGGILTALHAEQGPRLGLPQMIQSRAQFGFFGSLLPSLGAILVYYVYTTFLAVMAYQGLSSLLGWPPYVCVIVALSLSWVVAVLGYKAIHSINVVITVVSVITFLMFVVKVVPKVSTIDYTGKFAWAPFIAVVVFEVVGQLGNATFISDYTRYLPVNTDGRKVFLAVLLGGTGAAILVTCLGALAAAVNFDAINANVLGYMSSFYPSISSLLIVVLIVSTALISAMGLYSGYQTVMALVTSRGGRVSAVASRAIVAGAFAVAGGVTALNVGEDFIVKIGGLVTTLVYFLVPWSAINLTDFYLIRRGHYDVDAIADRNGKYGLFNAPAMVVYAVGVLVQIPFIISDFPRFTGPIAKALDGLNFAWIVGFVVCAVLYWAVEQRRHTGDQHKSTAVAAGND